MAVSMVTYLGFGPAEVAAALDISPGAAKVAVHRARRRLRAAISLEVLREQPALACAVMRPLLADPVESERHLESCEGCLGAASDEVMAFDISTTGGSPKGELAVMAPDPPPASPPR